MLQMQASSGLTDEQMHSACKPGTVASQDFVPCMDRVRRMSQELHQLEMARHHPTPPEFWNTACGFRKSARNLGSFA
jgi:hypothetical protein